MGDKCKQFISETFINILTYYQIKNHLVIINAQSNSTLERSDREIINGLRTLKSTKLKIKIKLIESARNSTHCTAIGCSLIKPGRKTHNYLENIKTLKLKQNPNYLQEISKARKHFNYNDKIVFICNNQATNKFDPK